MEDTCINETEKGASVEIASEGHGDCVLRYEEMVHAEFLPKGAPVNVAYHVEVMKRLRGIQTEKTKKVEEQVALQSQGILPHVTLYPTIFGSKKHSYHPASTLFT